MNKNTYMKLDHKIEFGHSSDKLESELQLSPIHL